MNRYHIRFNTQHDGSELKWRIFENGEEHLVRHFRVDVPVFDEQTLEQGVVKFNLCCLGIMRIENGVAHIAAAPGA
jgi:hypothetical protein